MLILAMIVIGMTSGWVAHWLVEGNTPYDWTRLFILGLAGSFVGGTLVNLLMGDGFALRPAGIVGSAIGATVILLAVRAATTAPVKHKPGSQSKKKKKRR